ncbi:three-helix bundle dimerization domain-containing protein [Streptomyces sp. NBC_00457]|uniref:three-helix bundle dimerization domain-containing protein n=1 Tax=Streptomyces sp. NBC_00457 TaxID=2975748 RepID=UPI003FCD36DB
MISSPFTVKWAVEPGSHCADTRPVGPPTPAAEQHARQDVRTRLLLRFPDAPPAVVDIAVAEAFAYFADARVRHYVPVLSLKRASGLLSDRLGARGAASGGP